MPNICGYKNVSKSSRKLKIYVTTTPLLSLPLSSGGFMVFYDTLRVGLGCVLMKNGRVISYASI